eukprot:scaffold223843_cov24-Tisochrysis_lutea.AAC.2
MAWVKSGEAWVKSKCDHGTVPRKHTQRTLSFGLARVSLIDTFADLSRGSRSRRKAESTSSRRINEAGGAWVRA